MIDLIPLKIQVSSRCKESTPRVTLCILSNERALA